MIFNQTVVKFEMGWKTDCWLDGLLQEGVSKQLVSTLYALESTIAQRKAEEAVPGGKPSWTKRLLESPELLCSKIR